MLCGLRYALLALKSHLLLVEQGAVVLLLGGRWAGRLRKTVLATEAILSTHGRSGRIQGSLSLGTELSLICKGVHVLLLLLKIEIRYWKLHASLKYSLTDSWAFNMGLFCWRFNLMFVADCWFQFAGLAWAVLVVCCANGGCLGDNCDALFVFELFACWKLFKICWLICCCWGERRWPPFELKGFCWKSKTN